MIECISFDDLECGGSHIGKLTICGPVRLLMAEKEDHLFLGVGIDIL